MQRLLHDKTLQKRYIKGFSIALAYVAFFFFVESLDLNYSYLHHPIDDLIPFNEFAILPYSSWFFYMAFTLIYFAHHEGDRFDRVVYLMFGGMAFCLIINMIWPSAVDLRPKVFPRENPITDFVRLLHKVDTPTNVCPSIHVYATWICHLALIRWSRLKNKMLTHLLSWFFCLSICMSILFLKQHSIIDLFWGVVVALVIWVLVNWILRNKQE